MGTVHNDALQQAVLDAQENEQPVEEVDAALSASVDDLNESADELGVISRDAEKASDLGMSLESHLQGYLDTVSVENWDHRVARQYRIGVAAILSAHGYEMPENEVSVSLEAAEKQTGEENRKENEAKTRGLVGKLYDMVVAALKSMGAAMKSFFSNLTKNATVVRTASQSLLRTAAKLPDGLDLSKAVDGREAVTLDGKSHAWAYYYTTAGTELSPSEIVRDCATEVIVLVNNWGKTIVSAVDRAKSDEAAGTGKSSGKKESIYISGGHLVDVSVVDEKLNNQGNGDISSVTMAVIKGSPPADGIPVMTRKEIEETARAMIYAAAQMDLASRDVTAKAESEKILKLVKEAKDATPGAAAKIRKLISKYPLAKRTLIPLIGATAMNAWRHANASARLLSKHETKPAKQTAAE